MQIRDRLSPNRNARAATIDMVVLHYTGMPTAAEALDRLCDPAAAVSAHYLIEEDGTVWRLVPEAERAWHAGVSHWAGASDINDRSIGVEIVNPGHEFGYRPFPEAQMAALEALLTVMIARHGIAPARVVGHSDVAPARKQDPGELFDWERLARRRLALPVPAGGDPLPADAAPDALATIGYDPEAPLDAVVTAFQRRFVRESVTGILDSRTLAVIAAVRRLCA